MDSILRITGMVNRVKSANPASCCEQILDLIDQDTSKSDVLVFPRMALCPPSSGTLLKNPCIAQQCEHCLSKLCEETKHLSSYLLIGTVKLFDHIPYEVYAILYEGKVLGYLPCETIPDGFDELLPPDSIFSCCGMTFTVLPTSLSKLPLHLPGAAQRGAQLVICPSYCPITSESFSELSSYAKSLSLAYGIGLIVCNGGVGDTSSPSLYRGLCEIYECGQLFGTRSASQESFSLTCDLDADIIRSQQKYRPKSRARFSADTQNEHRPLMRSLCAHPFLSLNPQKEKRRLNHLFELQVESLAARMSNTGLTRLVVGVSGGLDSTLALLVCQKALKVLELPPQNLLGVTMPGFGTSDRTYYNSLTLIQALGGENRDISIKASVLQHFEDIAHDPGVKDVTYENAQARERTQILFDLANACHGLVVGTGDMSEAALGWCTFNGDQMASYNINVCLPKTVIRRMVTHLSHTYDSAVGDVLRDIVDTPVSPELLPPDENGKISQKTEDILGSYELHDFFLYYLLKYNLRPKKLYQYACIAFSDTFPPTYIKEKLRLFLTRFVTSQFKRSCAPDFAKITELCLADYRLPSDCSPQSFVHELDFMDTES